MTAIAGVDLTFTGGLGLLVMPSDWDLDFNRCRVDTVHARGESGEELKKSARRVTQFCRRHNVSHIFVEAVLTHQAFNVVKLAKLAGSVAAEVWSELGLEVEFVPIASARKLCFGQVPRFPKGHPYHGKTKQVLHGELTKMGAPMGWTSDELDAFVIANFGAHKEGICCIAMPPPPKAKRRSRRQLELGAAIG